MGHRARDGDVCVVGTGEKERRDAPYLGDEVVDVVPGDAAVGDAPPPAEEVGGEDIAVGVEVVGDGDLVVLEGGGDEADAEGFARAGEVGGVVGRLLRGREGGGVGRGGGLEGGEEAVGDLAEGDKEGQVA